MHEPVLLKEVLECLDPKKGDSYLDLTAGYGGHAKAVLDITQNFQGSVLVDRDQMAIDQLQTMFASSGVNIIHDDYYAATKQLSEQGRQFDLILADLGISSPHLNTASRGFSFMQNGPLDMRMDQRQTMTAEDIVNQWDKPELIKILQDYGEEPRSHRIAESIIANRPLKNTEQLVAAITKVTGPKQAKQHPATRTFQALRIAVNNELDLLQKTLPLWVDLLKPNGRIGIIAFHSLEDRLVKQYFADQSTYQYEQRLKLITKRPITPGEKEIVYNPRSRSARLRAAVKIKTTERTSDAY